MKKVILVNSSLSGGGSERAMTNLANYLCNHNYSVTMVLLRKKKQEYELDEKVKVIELNNNFKKSWLFFKRIIDLRNIFKKETNFCIISFMTDINFFSIIASIGIRNKTLILSERNDPSSLRGKRRIIFKAVELLFYRFADKIVFQTENVKKLYSKKFAYKYVVIPNMVEADSDLRKESEINNEIIAVGRLTHQKNFQLLLSSFSEVRMKYPDLKLSIYGEGPLKEELEHQSRVLGLTNIVNFFKFDKNILPKMAKAKIFVSTSNYEGISNAMLEALALGVPSICTDCPVGGAALAIQSGVNGFLFKVGNKNELVEKINEIMTNHDLYTYISKNAVISMDKFSPKVIGKQWEGIIQ